MISQSAGHRGVLHRLLDLQGAVQQRQDIQLAKFFSPFSGWFLTAKFRYFPDCGRYGDASELRVGEKLGLDERALRDELLSEGDDRVSARERRMCGRRGERQDIAEMRHSVLRIGRGEADVGLRAPGLAESLGHRSESCHPTSYAVGTLRPHCVPLLRRPAAFRTPSIRLDEAGRRLCASQRQPLEMLNESGPSLSSPCRYATCCRRPVSRLGTLETCLARAPQKVADGSTRWRSLDCRGCSDRALPLVGNGPHRYGHAEQLTVSSSSTAGIPLRLCVRPGTGNGRHRSVQPRRRRRHCLGPGVERVRAAHGRRDSATRGEYERRRRCLELAPGLRLPACRYRWGCRRRAVSISTSPSTRRPGCSPA